MAGAAMSSLWGPFTETVDERRRKLDELLSPVVEALKTLKITPEELKARVERAHSRTSAFRPRLGPCSCNCSRCTVLG